MRILINSINYFPELTGIGKYTGEMAEWLASRGFEVRVVTAPPYYPAWKIGSGYRGKWYSKEHRAGVTVTRCPLWVPCKPTGITRILHLASFAISCFPLMLWQALTWRPNITLVIEPPLFCAPGAWLTAKISLGTAWLHVQDFEVDAAFDLGILRFRFLQTIVTAFERWLLRRFDRVSTISERMLERLASKGVRADRRMLFPNWVDTLVIRPLEPPYPLRKEFGVPEEGSVLLYSGNMGKKQGLEILIDAAKILSHREDILFVLCGDGVAREDLEGAAASMPNIKFLPLQSAERLNDLLNMADVHLLPQRVDAEDLVMPSKLASMLASGRPVIATAREGTQVADVVKQCGVVVKPGDAARLKSAILQLVDDRVAQKRLGDAGRKYATEHWSREKVLARVFNDPMRE